MTLPRLLLLEAGNTRPEMVATHGDYVDWFYRAFAGGASRFDTIPVHRGGKLPDPDVIWRANRRREGPDRWEPRDPAAWGGAIITGSPSSVRDEADWMGRLALWAIEAAEAGLPILGICFGHQLLGEALGGRLEPSPRGWEGGSVEVELTPEGMEDPLFAGLPSTLLVQATHQDELVVGPPSPRAIRLAGNRHSEWQAFAAGPRIRGVQFHPEATASIAARVVELRAEDRPVAESDHGRRILRNWEEHFVLRPAIPPR